MSSVAAVVLAAGRRRAEGNVAEAERLYRRALAQDPRSAAAARELGELLADASRVSEALEVVTGATRARPNNAELLALLGRCLCMSGRPHEAVDVLRSALRLDPACAAARLWVANALVAVGRAREAEPQLRAMLASSPVDARVHTALGHACVAQGKRLEAVGHFRHAVRLSPGAAGHSDLAYALYITDRLEESLAEFEAALSLNPRLASAVGGKAMILADRGARDQTRSFLNEAIEAGLLDTVLALTYARVSNAPEHRPAARAVLERALAREHATPAERASLLLSLGSLREADGEYEAAFECFRTGNDLIPPMFDKAAMEQSAAEVRRVFSREAVPHLARSDDSDPLPVFVVGMPRSGTSLVEQILASHSAVYGAGELSDIAALAQGVAGLPGLPPGSAYPACVRAMTPDQATGLARGHLARLRHIGTGAARVVDKMPLNFLHLGLIDLLFPGARIIHCVRHPLDTCLSCYTTLYSRSHGYRSRLDNLAAVYRVYHEMMEHWRPLLRTPMIDVRYEDVVAEPEANARRLVEFLGLPWEDRCLRFHESQRVVRTASTDQVRRPIYGSSVGRWKHYEAHLGGLIDALKDLC